MEAVSGLVEGLEAHNYETVSVRTGEEALAVMREQEIDLLLLNLALPDMDGMAVYERLAAEGLLKDVPVIFASEHDIAGNVRTEVEKSDVAWMRKPYNVPMVMICTELALRERECAQGDTSMSNGTYIDTLTGLKTRDFVLERLQEEVDKAHRYNFPVSCVVIDIDDLEPLDDELGPVSLDDLLAEAAISIRSYSRTYDVLGRFEGSVFVAVLPHAPLDKAQMYARKIMDAFDSTTFADPNFPTRVRTSASIVSCSNGAATGADKVFGEAMKLLLQAKSCSKDRLVAVDLNDHGTP